LDPVLRYDDGGLVPLFDPFRSIVESIQDASDHLLLQVHEYVFGEAAPSPVHGRARVIAEGVWTPEYFRLFVSHTHAHRQDVGNLKRVLAPFWIDAFVAHDDIEPTRPGRT
jgi:hypothetical protein